MKYLLTIIALLAVAVSAQAQSAPLPESLLQAKTATVINGGINQDYFDRFVLELRDWKRFTLVDTAADITITLTGSNTIGAVANVFTGQMMNVPAVEYRMAVMQGERMLYNDQLKGCCSFKAMARKTLEKLDKRMAAANASTVGRN